MDVVVVEDVVVDDVVVDVSGFVVDVVVVVEGFVPKIFPIEVSPEDPLEPFTIEVIGFPAANSTTVIVPIETTNTRPIMATTGHRLDFDRGVP